MDREELLRVYEPDLPAATAILAACDALRQVQ